MFPGTTFIVSNRIWCFVFAFSLNSRNLFLFFLDSFIIHSALFKHEFECFLPFLLLWIPSFSLLWSHKIHDIVSVFLGLLRLSLHPNMWPIKGPQGAENTSKILHRCLLDYIHLWHYLNPAFSCCSTLFCSVLFYMILGKDGHFVLGNFLSCWKELESFKKKKPQWRKQLPMGNEDISWLINDVGGPCLLCMMLPWAAGPGLY